MPLMKVSFFSVRRKEKKNKSKNIIEVNETQKFYGANK
jgi:hypothetical protein